MYYEKTKTILVQQPFASFYIISIAASKLVQIVHSIPAEYSNGQLDGVQRSINKKRIDNISGFCLSEKPLFPNTIILAANIKQDGEIVEEEQQWYVDDDCLIIPSSVKAASIVDGQHRIEGLKKALDQDMDDFNLVCAIYMDLPTPKQAEVFATINFNQQKVDKSLAYQLFGYDLDTSEPKYWAPDTLAISITRILEKQSTSPFKNHIGFGVKEFNRNSEDLEGKANLKGDYWKVSTSTMVAGISSLISKNSIEDRYKLHKKRLFKKDRDILELGEHPVPPLRGLYLEYKDTTIYNIVESFFCIANSILWSNPETILRKTIGIQALFDILKRLLSQHEITCYEDKEKLKDYFHDILSNIDVEEIDTIGKNYSGSGRVAIRNKLFQQIGIS